MQRKALRQWKNLIFSKDICFEKNRVRLKTNPRKVGLGLKQRGMLNKRRKGLRLPWWRSIDKKEASHLFGLRGRHQFSDQDFSRIRTPCVDSNAAGTEGGERNGQGVSIKRAADGKRWRRRKVINEKRENYWPRTDSCGAL